MVPTFWSRQLVLNFTLSDAGGGEREGRGRGEREGRGEGEGRGVGLFVFKSLYSLEMHLQFDNQPVRFLSVCT